MKDNVWGHGMTLLLDMRPNYDSAILLRLGRQGSPLTEKAQTSKGECNATGSVLYIVLWSLLVQLDSEPTTCGYDVVYETLVETENVCARKVVHGSYENARAALRTIRRIHPTDARQIRYQCRWCGRWPSVITSKAANRKLAGSGDVGRPATASCRRLRVRWRFITRDLVTLADFTHVSVQRSWTSNGLPDLVPLPPLN